MRVLHALRQKLNHRGATLMEMLLSVALLIVLLGIVTIGIVSLTRKLRQTELDSKAETIYTAVQNQLVALRAAGCESLYSSSADGVTPLHRVPMDADTETIKADTLYYVVHSGDTVSGAVSSILPASCVESEIRNNNWVIEYSPADGSVYAVFYSESALSYAPDSFDVFRFREKRLSGGATIGYYGGDSVHLSDTYKLKPTLTLSNREKLIAEISCTAPSDDRLHFLLEISDGTHTEKKDITASVALSGTRKYTCSYVLDAAKAGQHFHELFKQLTPGADITLRLTVTSPNPLVDSGTVESQPCNSLFASVDGSTAAIAYCRHLQNLNQSSSGVGTLIQYAQQQSNLYFSDDMTNDEDWYTYYGANAFTPIINDSLRTYTGSYDHAGEAVQTVIYGLSTNNATSCGLFSAFSGDLKDIWLSGTLLSHHTYSGALAGTVSGSTTIDGCRVYLDRITDELDNKNSGNVWIKGSYVGGLVGFVNGGSLTIRNSFAASVVGTSASTCAGGLVGLAAGNVTISQSYADCYLTGSNTGGLVARTTGTNRVTLLNCYAAGYQDASVSGAGLVNGSVESMANTYSACSFDNLNAVLYSTAVSSAAADNGKTYYLLDDLPEGTEHIANTVGQSYAQMHDLTTFTRTLGAAFTGSNGGYTTPYNLERQGLSDYSFPRLADLPHYGDWQAQFEPDSLVYYEEYAGGSFGFFGGNVDTLRSDLPVVGDGYGIVSNKKPQKAITCKSKGGTVSLPPNDYKVYNSDSGKSYYLRVLPVNVVNTTYAPAGFYQEIAVKPEDRDGDVIYYYNPHFAKTVVTSDAVPTTPASVAIRTARQLYNLSLYYASYADTKVKTTFRQELDVAYASYDWAAYANTTVTEQQPIGSNAAAPFSDIYDGGCHTISGVSVASASTELYTGLFGYVDDTGVLRNIVLSAQTEDGRTVTCGKMLQGGMDVAYVGTLAGLNQGTIFNCAVAGYAIHMNLYSSSTVYLGGLVGRNERTIRNSSADCPALSVAATYANAHVGGFVGNNIGLISNCYALGIVEAKEARGSDVSLSGFAGSHSGVIQNSYCATAILAAGDSNAYGFAPTGGALLSCSYLYGGTYDYLGNIYPYDADSVPGVAQRDYENFAGATLASFGKATASSYHGGTAGAANGGSDDYPFPAVVTNAADARVHYGDWVSEANLGVVGVFYWEEETGGANAGLHFSYAGVTGSGNAVSGSTLCTAHDDGGIISRYGYGYYTPENKTAVLTHSGFAGLGAEDERVSDAIKAQTKGYSFTAYVTTEDATQGTYLAANTVNGTWMLTLDGVARTFSVNPFFANAMAYTDNGAARPGSSNASAYQIRSAQQLQYVNWNSLTRNTYTAISSMNHANNSAYPYLSYVDSNTTTATGGKYVWQQTHDVDARMQPDGTETFTPIGSLYDSASGDVSTTNINMACFRGSYDGGAYAIKNLEISTSAQCIGLFGITLEAHLQNISLYSENSNHIEAIPGSVKWYNIGGLVGYAAQGNDTGSAISNCTVSGYRIEDHRDANGGWGGANIGGLIGATNMDIDHCSAVNDITLAFTYTVTTDSANTWKNVRVGGLVGGCRSTISNCYAGGKIVSAVNLANDYIGDAPCSNIWVGGITGGIVMKTGGTLTSLIGSLSKQARVENCYSYVELPPVHNNTNRNHVRASLSIASNGEMQNGGFVNLDDGTAMSMEIVNCYCFADNVVNCADPFKNGSWTGENYYNTGMHQRDDRYISINNNGRNPYLTYDQMTSGTLQGYLGSGFGTVTTTENGAAVNGKYSFPGNDMELDGLDYPFPTVLTQKNIFGDSVNVHYGAWPKMGLFWEKGRSEMDLLRDYDEAAQRSSMTMALSVRGVAGFDGTQTPTFTYTGSAGVAAVDSYAYSASDGRYDVVIKGLTPGVVNITAQIVIGGKTYTSTTVLTVTADLIIKAEPSSVTLEEASATDITLSATSKPLADSDGTDGIKDYTENVTWSFTYDDESVAACTPRAGGGNAYTVTALHQGESAVYITGTLELGGKTYTGVGSLAAITTRAPLVGLASTAETESYYNQMALSAGGSGTYISPTDFAAGDLPALSGESLFLYAGGTGVRMTDISIKKAEVKLVSDTDLPFTLIYENGTPLSDVPYLLQTGLSESGGRYDYLPLQLQGRSDADVMLRLTLNWAGSEDPASEFILNVPVHITGVTLNAVFLNPDGTPLDTLTVPLGGMPDLSGFAALPVDTGEVAEGYHYLASPTDLNFWRPSITTMTEDTEFIPKAYANTGTIHYDANAPVGVTVEGETLDQTVSYDTAAVAAECGFTIEDYTFIGWAETATNTAADYAKKDDISELVKRGTANNGASITLYAVWQRTA